MDIANYWEDTKTRFLNPTVQDLILRNCADGASRQPKFIVPNIKDHVKRGTDMSGLAIVSAMWCKYCMGTAVDGSAIEPSELEWDKLNKLAKASIEDPSQWLSQTDVYGDLKESKAFVTAFSNALKMIEEKGVEGAMQAYIDGDLKLNAVALEATASS